MHEEPTATSDFWGQSPIPTLQNSTEVTNENHCKSLILNYLP